MLHNYIIISDDKVTIDFKINELLAKIPYNEKEIIKYDMSITPISVVLEQLNTYNLLSECKIIICYNCNFLEGENCKDIANLKEYLINCSENYLIMIATKVSEKKEVIDSFFLFIIFLLKIFFYMSFIDKKINKVYLFFTLENFLYLCSSLNLLMVTNL